MDALVVELIHRVEADLRALLALHETEHHADGGEPHIHDDPEEIRPAHEILHAENDTAPEDIREIEADVEGLTGGAITEDESPPNGHEVSDSESGDIVEDTVEAPAEALEEAGDIIEDMVDAVTDAVQGADEQVVDEGAAPAALEAAEAIEDAAESLEAAADSVAQGGAEGASEGGELVGLDEEEEAPARPHALHRRIIG